MHGDRLLPVEWVMIARWEFASGLTEFCVEYLDASGETAGEDVHLRSEQEAEQHAAAEFGVVHSDWRGGHPTPASA